MNKNAKKLQQNSYSVRNHKFQTQKIQKNIVTIRVTKTKVNEWRNKERKKKIKQKGKIFLCRHLMRRHHIQQATGNSNNTINTMWLATVYGCCTLFKCLHVYCCLINKIKATSRPSSRSSSIYTTEGGKPLTL